VDAIKLLRPMDRSAVNIPLPTADMSQTLGLCQIVFLSTQRLFICLAFCDVLSRAMQGDYLPVEPRRA
jgi:hypothetical protein